MPDLTAAVPAHGQDHIQAGKTVKLDADRTFLMTAGQGGYAEVVLAHLAAKKATNDEVKKLAQRIEKDHSANNQEMKSLATAKNVIMSTTLDAEHQQLNDRLEKLEGASFDNYTADGTGTEDDTPLDSRLCRGSTSRLRRKTLPTCASIEESQRQAAGVGATSTTAPHRLLSPIAVSLPAHPPQPPPRPSSADGTPAATRLFPSLLVVRRLPMTPRSYRTQIQTSQRPRCAPTL